MSKKRRVFQVARELNISNEAVLEFLGKKDKAVKTQMSAVSEELYDEICQEWRGEPAPGEQALDFRAQLKEKHILEEMRRNKAKQELEERLRFATQLAEERPTRLEEARKAKEEEEAQRDATKRLAAEESARKKEEAAAAEMSVVDMISQAKKQIDAEEKSAKEKRGHESKSAPPPAEPKVEAEEVVAPKEQPKAEDKAAASGVEEAKKKEVTPVESKPATPEKKPAADTQKDRRRKGKKKKKRKISEEEIQANIKQTLAAMDETKPKRRRRKSKDVDGEMIEEEVMSIRVNEYISAAELAEELGVESGEILKACLELGMMVSINQRLDMDIIEAVADEFGFQVEKLEEYGTDIIDQYEDSAEDEAKALPRPPVVTIMGHVDHGKTSLLDYIRSSTIISGEAGGITQHIGAYEVEVGGKEITFLDTPGHEAFTAMRARGAQVTDLVVLIVAADDGVQPQTVEAINHAMAASAPVVVAINKIDKPTANIEAIKKQLADHNVLVEEWGGKYQTVEVSAKTGQGIDRLLELILLEAELLELKANPDRMASGIIIEAQLDKGKGPVGTVLVQKGTLKVGDLFVAGSFGGKVRAMYDERSKAVKKAGPSTPVQVIGFDDVPQAGDSFTVLDSEREVREISTKRRQLKREHDFRKTRHMSLDQLSQQIKHGRVKELNIILKADVDGSNEALSDALMKVSNEEVSVNVIHKAVGGISESDVLLASASEAIIIGFHVRPTTQARELAKKEEIDIRLYDIIYAAVEEVKAALEGMLDPEITEELTATIEVRETFKVPKVGTIAGSYVVSGKASRNDYIRIYREDKLLHETRLSSLKRFKEDVREVASGFECGVGLEGFDDIKIGDVFETYRQVETARKL